MYKSCKTEKSAQRQSEIENRFIKLLSQKHFDEITVSEICRELDIPRKAFYRYFETKESILKAATDHILLSYESYSKNTKESSKRTVTNELTAFFEFWLLEPQQQLLSALKKNNMYGHLIQSSINYSSGQLAGISKFIRDENDLVRSQLFPFAITGLMSMMLKWYDGEFRKSTHEMALAAKRMLTEPLFPNLETWGIFDE